MVRKRIDIMFSKSADDGFFPMLVQSHKILCPYIAVDCKNYSEDPNNPEFGPVDRALQSEAWQVRNTGLPEDRR
jgi:hypothetical protein